MKTGENPKPRERIGTIDEYTFIIKETILLPKSSQNPSTLFFDVLNKRSSSRSFSVLSLQQVSNLLWASAKVKTVRLTMENNILSKRPTPSAGSIHPIDILISLPVEMSERRLYYYNPFTHALALLETDSRYLVDFFSEINNNMPIEKSTILWASININKTSAFYENPESLYWRDTGALLATIQLVATALEIKSCMLGTLAQNNLNRVFSNKPGVFSGGGILLG